MARNAKVATVIENETGQGLTLKVANPHCFVRMASVKRGQHYTVRLCVDWTFQEFMLEDASDAAKKLFVNSDDCCDYERITVKESDHGVLYTETVARKQLFGGGESAAAVRHRSSFLAKNIMDKMCRWTPCWAKQQW